MKKQIIIHAAVLSALAYLFILNSQGKPTQQTALNSIGIIMLTAGTIVNFSLTVVRKLTNN
jgi:hypothetical protein